jgi:hypothetical protein
MDYAKKMVEELGVPLRVLDIDVAMQEKTADRLIEEYGDFVEDYIIPQVFLEYEGGRVEHIFTGFSESVQVTEARWISLLKSKFYQNLLQTQKKDNYPIDDFIKRHLVFKMDCRRHCSEPADFRILLTEKNGVIGVYSCLGGFVSRVIYYSLDPNLDWFYTFLSSQLGKKMVRKQDLRTATRYGWELDEHAAADLAEFTSGLHTPVIREVYWVHHPWNDAEKSTGVFLCSDQEQGRGCGRLFIQEVTSKDRFCPKCK